MVRQRHSYPWDIWKSKQPEISPEPRKAVKPASERKPLSERFVVKGDIAEIYSSNGTIAIIDAEDLDRVKHIYWCERTGYFSAYSRAESRNIYLHRIILPPPPGLFVDHIDGDRLNNRKSNLRIATRAQNGWNRKGKNKVKGVSWDRTHQAFTANICVNGHHHHLGCYDTIEEAAQAYDNAAAAVHGEFAKTNDTPTGVVTRKRRGIKEKASPYKGAYWCKKSETWFSAIKIHGKRRHLGTFKTDVEAAKAYDKASIEKYGADAILNFPDPEVSYDPAKKFLPRLNSVKTKALEVSQPSVME